MIRLQTVLSCREAQGTTRPSVNGIQRVGAAAGAGGGSGGRLRFNDRGSAGWV